MSILKRYWECNECMFSCGVWIKCAQLKKHNPFTKKCVHVCNKKPRWIEVTEPVSGFDRAKPAKKRWCPDCNSYLCGNEKHGW